jgi:hypothetical protein
VTIAVKTATIGSSTRAWPSRSSNLPWRIAKAAPAATYTAETAPASP